MLGLNGIIIDWSLPSKLKSIWINQLLSRKSLSSGQETILKLCTLHLTGLYFVLSPKTQWEGFSFLLGSSSELRRKHAFTETGFRSQVIWWNISPRKLALLTESKMYWASQNIWPGGLASSKTLVLGTGQPVSPVGQVVKSALEYSMDGTGLYQQWCL